MNIEFDSDTDDDQENLWLGSKLAINKDQDASFNRDNSPDLICKGILDGRAIGIDASGAETLASTPVSHVLRAPWNWVLRSGSLSRKLRLEGMKDDVGGLRGYVVVKLARDDCPAPHNPAREARILGRIQQQQQQQQQYIAKLLNAYLLASDGIYHMFLPYYPLPLRSLLSSSSFACSDSHPRLVQSLTYQAFSALDYIHNQLDPPIAHRDVNPGNFVLNSDGSLILIDFSVAIACPMDNNNSNCSQPLPQDTEEPGHMLYELGTGPYRAPELLFGSESYDARALDLWSLGATLAEFYTTLKKSKAHTKNEHEHNSTSLFTMTTAARKRQRIPLFDTSGSDIRLIASIFRIRGTPTIDTWPEAKYLDDFGKIEFNMNKERLLQDVLIPDNEQSPSSKVYSRPSLEFVDLITNLLQISASKRLRANQAFEHEYLANKQDIQLPCSSSQGEYMSMINQWLKPAMSQQSFQ